MNIDPATGLPELPEGQYWEVTEDKTEYYPSRYFTSYPKREGGYYLKLREDKTETIIHSNVRHEWNPKYKWWKNDGEPQTFTHVTETEEVKGSVVTLKERRLENFDQEGWDKALESYKERLSEWEKKWGSEYEKHVRLDSIRRASYSIYDGYTHFPYGPSWYGDPNPIHPSVGTYKSSTLDEDSIRKASEEIMAEIAEEKRKASLLGKYPPNKLS